MDPTKQICHNFCRAHASLRQPTPVGAPLQRQERTPAPAAGLPDHGWTLSELLPDPIPLPLGVAPQRRGRPPKARNLPATRIAA